MNSDKLDLSLRDLLALDRTRLANHRTLLAFVVTSMHVAALGVTFNKVEEFSHLAWLSLPLMVLGAVVFTIGVIGYFKIRRDVNRAYSKI